MVVVGHSRRSRDRCCRCAVISAGVVDVAVVVVVAVVLALVGLVV